MTISSVRKDLLQYGYVIIGITAHLLYSELLSPERPRVNTALAVYDTALNIIALFLLYVLGVMICSWAGLSKPLDFYRNMEHAHSSLPYGVFILVVAYASGGVIPMPFFGLCLGVLTCAGMDLRADIAKFTTVGVMTGTSRGLAAMMGVVACATAALCLVMLMVPALNDLDFEPVYRGSATRVVIHWLLPVSMPVCVFIALHYHGVEMVPEMLAVGLPPAFILSLAWVGSSHVLAGYTEPGVSNVTDTLFYRPVIAPTHFALAVTTHFALVAFFATAVYDRTVELMSALVLGFSIRQLVFAQDDGGAVGVAIVLLNCMVLAAVISRILYNHDPEGPEPLQHGAQPLQQLPEEMHALNALNACA